MNAYYSASVIDFEKNFFTQARNNIMSMKGETFMKYTGWILPPALRDFHEGRIWLKNHSPFLPIDIDKAITHQYFHILEGIQKIHLINVIVVII